MFHSKLYTGKFGNVSGNQLCEQGKSQRKIFGLPTKGYKPASLFVETNRDLFRDVLSEKSEVLVWEPPNSY